MRELLVIILASIFLFNGCSPTSTEVKSKLDSLHTNLNSSNGIYTGALSDLKDFPKDWVMITNITPDSIIGNYVVKYDSDSNYYGVATIVYDNNVFGLTVKNYLEADVYEIKSCKRIVEAEMIYYNFELINSENKSLRKLQINYRENPENPQGSVWFFGDGITDNETMEFVSKPLSKSFKPYYNQEE